VSWTEQLWFDSWQGQNIFLLSSMSQIASLLIRGYQVFSF